EACSSLFGRLRVSHPVRGRLSSRHCLLRTCLWHRNRTVSPGAPAAVFVRAVALPRSRAILPRRMEAARDHDHDAACASPHQRDARLRSRVRHLAEADDDVWRVLILSKTKDLNHRGHRGNTENIKEIQAICLGEIFVFWKKRTLCPPDFVSEVCLRVLCGSSI